MKETYLKTIREACIKANPEIEVPRETMYTNVGVVTPWEIIGRPIRLADILLAIYSKWGARTVKLDEEGYGEFKNYEIEIIIKLLKRWKVSTDDLTQQSEETLKFISELLTDNK